MAEVTDFILDLRAQGQMKAQGPEKQKRRPMRAARSHSKCLRRCVNRMNGLHELKQECVCQLGARRRRLGCCKSPKIHPKVADSHERMRRRLLTLMSIRDEIRARLDEERLRLIKPLMAGSPEARLIYASYQLHEAIRLPHADPKEAARRGRLQADFDRFINGRLITMGGIIARPI